MRAFLVIAGVLSVCSFAWAEEDIAQTLKREKAAACEGRANATDLKIGMARVDILRHKFWDYPANMSKTTSAAGDTEVFRYECDGYATVRLVIVNGKLSSIHR